MKPPFRITSEILNLCTEITLLLGRYEGLTAPVPEPQLRKHTKIVTIQSSLAIEGNTLTTDQVTDIVNHKRVKGPQKDILEVKNAITAYDTIQDYEPGNLESLLLAHKFLMKNLVENAGAFRKSNVGVHSSEGVIHKAPKHTLVPELMTNLLEFLRKETDLHPLIMSSVFHYEFEFIHPFMDGNGRLGRLWQSVILYNYRKIFEYIPVETVVKRRQEEYYKALHQSNVEGESTIFVKFMLETIKEATTEFAQAIKPVKQTAQLRIDLAKTHFGQNTFSRKDYLQLHRNISTASGSRDLALAVEKGLLEKLGNKATTTYRFKG